MSDPGESSEANAVEGDNGHGGRSRWVVGLLAVVAVYAVGVVVLDVEEALGAFWGASLAPLTGALLMQVLAVVFWSRVYISSAHATGRRVGLRDGLRVTMPAFTLSHTLPGGGWAGNALVVQRLTMLGMDGPVALAAVALASSISMTVVAALGVTGIAAAFIAGDLPRSALLIALPVLVVLVLVVVTVVAVLRSPTGGDRVVRAIGRVHPRLRRRVDDWRDSLRHVTHDPPSNRRLLAIARWALLKWTADIASLALIFFSVDQVPRVSALLLGFGATQLATAIPITPGGAGFVEGGMVGAFVVLGYSGSTSASIVVLYRVLETWLPALAGVPLLLRGPAADDGHAH